MSREHVIIAPESTIGTWATPNLAFPVNKVAAKLGREYSQRYYTGTGRGVSKNLNLGVMPSGSIELDAFPDHLGLWLKAAGFSSITTTTPSGATNAREHGLLISDAVILPSLSAQLKYDGSHALNILRMTFDKFSLKCAGGSEVGLTFDWVAKDLQEAGAKWNHDPATDSPAIISTPVYIGSSLKPYMFYEAALVSGGTSALDGTTKQMSLSGASVLASVESLELTLENSLEPYHTLNADPTAHDIPAGELNISLKLDVDWSTINMAYFRHFRDGTGVALQLTLKQGGDSIESGQDYLFQVTLPNLSFSAADLPDIEGGASRRVQTVEATALHDGTTGHNIGITLRDTQTSY